jgi:hypothetical protein
MNNAAELDVTCADSLKDNRRLYAHKARRKKIAMISFEAINPGPTEIRIVLGAATLVADGQRHGVESPAIILRECREFTWDFLVYAILDFHPVLVFVDAAIFLTGPLYNRRLQKQLHLLTASDMIVAPGACRTALLGFRGVPKGPAQLQFSYRRDDEPAREMKRDIALAGR